MEDAYKLMITVPPESHEKGFSDKSAEKYARAVAMIAKFGLEDDLIKDHIQKYLEAHADIQQLWNSVAAHQGLIQGGGGGMGVKSPPMSLQKQFLLIAMQSGR